jgi:hypothetical protein
VIAAAFAAAVTASGAVGPYGIRADPAQVGPYRVRDDPTDARHHWVIRPADELPAHKSQ